MYIFHDSYANGAEYNRSIFSRKAFWAFVFYEYVQVERHLRVIT